MILINQVPRNIVIVAVVKLLKNRNSFFLLLFVLLSAVLAAHTRFARKIKVCVCDFFSSVRVRMCGVWVCVRVSLRSIDGHFRFTSMPTALSKMVIKCIVLNNFSKVIYIFLLLFAFDKYQTSLHVYHYLPPFGSCYLASFYLQICCCFEQKETNG